MHATRNILHVSEEGSRSVRAMFICTRLKEEEKNGKEVEALASSIIILIIACVCVCVLCILNATQYKMLVGTKTKFIRDDAMHEFPVIVLSVSLSLSRTHIRTRYAMHAPHADAKICTHVVRQTDILLLVLFTQPNTTVVKLVFFFFVAFFFFSSSAFMCCLCERALKSMRWDPPTKSFDVSRVRKGEPYNVRAYTRYR